MWIKTENSGYITVETPNLANYYTSLSTFQIFPATSKSFKFHIKACSNAFVLLSAAINLDPPDVYEICIGGGDNTVIFLRILRKGLNTEEHYQFDAPDLLNCTQYKTFVLDWGKSGRITLTAETGIVMDWTDTSPIPIQGVGIMTAWGSDGMWIVEHFSQINGFYCSEPGTYGNMTILSTIKKRNIVTCVFACSFRDGCLGVNFNLKTEECQIIAGGQQIIKAYVQEWQFYIKC
ncbi:Hypothetical predicted protein [Mytilus galloprovincialis]|uniref:Farnesoic acid O-methyl transferase domain-containing protein n=1 Tax=Mytilus galloprovincialis TaxID=29158 RepID=A0A8B6BVP3_MYTGA|nr:Hypothetical predicted protein [Mytilus galloprovincialis]